MSTTAVHSAPAIQQVRSRRSSQIAACVAASLITLGFFSSPIGAWTGPILAVWFVGTQKPRRGFFWMLAFSFIPDLIFGWRSFPLTGPTHALEFLGWSLLAAVLGILPFIVHRLTSPRLPGFLATLSLPLATIAIPSLALALHISHTPTSGVHTFLTHWFAATLIWFWNRESRATTFVFAAGVLLAAAVELTSSSTAPISLSSPHFTSIFGPTCLALTLLFSAWALFRPTRHKSWASRPQSVATLQSPFTQNPLHVVTEQGSESLVSTSGERFPISQGIPNFLKPQDLTGDNGKYNHLYETIGGFYDDTQRVFGAIRGLDLDSYFETYMSLLQVKPGDSVLETSVGTGLNFKYLPQGTKLSGLDLSPEMLARCQNNLLRWNREADLYAGNAEALPFADSTFDAVFTCGGFNFFSDRAKAIHEMIRVARPGAHLMIEDETEEYVKSTYEKIPYTSSFYNDRKQPVTVPIDLVPPEMEDIRVHMLKAGKFYAITFRKPEQQEMSY
jgi:ubiquinone/menaquinone biosynthesis C-methylase UbiE